MDISNIFEGFVFTQRSTAPLYKQLSEFIKTKIQDQTLTVGTRLPAERELALLLGVSRTTAINAYRELEQGELIVSKTGSGTYVADTIAVKNGAQEIYWSQILIPRIQTEQGSSIRELISSPVNSKVIATDAGMPDPAYYPLAKIRSITDNLYQLDSSRLFGHLPTEGYPPLRDRIAGYLATRQIDVISSHTIIVSGSQQALYLLIKTMLEPGDSVMLQSPTYLGALQMFQTAGIRMLPLPVSERFPLSQMEDYILRYRPRMLYLGATFQNPTGLTLTDRERQEIINLGRKHQLIIVEDDPYSELYFTAKPPAPLKAYDDYGGVVYVGTYSKILFPGLRIGYAVAHPALINRMALEKQYMDLHSNNLAQLIVTALLEKDYLQEHLAKVRSAYSDRSKALAKALKGEFGEKILLNLPDGGFYLWCTFTGAVNTEKLLHEAIKTGVSFVPGRAFYPEAESGSQMRICYASCSEPFLEKAAGRLKAAFLQYEKMNGFNRENDKNSSRTIV